MPSDASTPLPALLTGDAAAEARYTHKPSVGTWLLSPVVKGPTMEKLRFLAAQPPLVQRAPAFAFKPSVGSWLQARPILPLAAAAGAGGSAGAKGTSSSCGASAKQGGCAIL
mmetsp:Transcript_107810/g.310503  ORF Transcript_107810/g.310503 Transcript_107810/m.310503 type:complete len:112 (-) Transcript_107810:255-590(-)